MSSSPRTPSTVSTVLLAPVSPARESPARESPVVDDELKELMKIPCPPTALPEAWRVVCMRPIRAYAEERTHRKNGELIDHNFHSGKSKKCAICSAMKDKCNPVPIYVHKVFKRLLPLLKLLWAAIEAGDDYEDKLATVVPLCKALNEQVHIMTSSIKSEGLSTGEVTILARLDQVETRLDDLNCSMVEMENCIEEMKKGPIRGPGGKFQKRTIK